MQFHYTGSPFGLSTPVPRKGRCADGLLLPRREPFGVFAGGKTEALFEIAREVGKRGIGERLGDLGDGDALNQAGGGVLKAAVGVIALGGYPEIVLEGLVKIGRGIAEAARERLGREGGAKAVVKMRPNAQ